MPRLWSVKDRENFYRHWPNIELISQLVNRPKKLVVEFAAVRNLLQRKRLPQKGNRKDKLKYEYTWSEQEIKALKKLWPNTKAISERLSKTNKAVRAKGMSLGLPKILPPGKRYSQQELDFIATSVLPVKEVAAKLQRTRKAIATIRAELRKRDIKVMPLPDFRRPAPSRDFSSETEY